MSIPRRLNTCNFEAMQPIELDACKQALDKNGFAVINAVFTDHEIMGITDCIKMAGKNRRPKDVFAVRKIFTAFPGIKEKLLNNSIKSIVHSFFGSDYFLVKGLYFNKPSLSNWFVAYHQDLSIAVSNKTDAAVYKCWTVKGDSFGVQPPVGILEKIYTIRIHLDDCTPANGALHVIPGSHTQGIYEAADLTEIKKTEVICGVPKGGIMLMRPLLLHASHKSVSSGDRRVLHLEFCNTGLPENIQWAEKELIF